MKIQRHAKNKKIFIPLIVAVTLLVLLGVYLYGFKGSLFGWKPTGTNLHYDAPTKDQLEAGDTIKNTSAKNSNSGENPNDVGSDHPEKPIANTGDGKATASLTITAANQNDGVLQLRTLIGALVSDGTCTLTLTQGNKTVTRTAGVQPTSNSTTCKGFDVPLSELSTGEWSVNIIFENSTLKASAVQIVKVL